MPKRKRGEHGVTENDPLLLLEQRKKDLEEKLVHGKKLLNRSLKTAKGFEWQKLGKRIKVAREKKDDSETGRLARELEALKSLDLPTIADAHLHKTVLKSKTLVESEVLEDYVKAVVKRINGSDAEALAMSNVTARLYNTKPVKETITYIMASIYGAVGIQNPAVTSNQSIKPLTGSKPVENDIRAIEVAHDERHEAIESDEDKFVAEPDWDGFESKDESDRESEGYSRYDELLGSSSDDGSQLVEDSDGGIRRPSVASRRTIRSRGLSVSVSGSSQSPSPPPQGKRTSKPPPQATKPGSTFLPTLMGGYWSGSEESATDDDEAAPAPRKNRPGQQARRAIWEKKFGVRANHLKDQAKAKAKDVHWDPKRGATASDGRANGRGNGRRAGFVRSREQVTGENAIAVKPRVRVIGRKDDVGALHPSWEATKKAKAKEKTAKFEGKKVVFD